MLFETTCFFDINTHFLRFKFIFIATPQNRCHRTTKHMYKHCPINFTSEYEVCRLHQTHESNKLCLKSQIKRYSEIQVLFLHWNNVMSWCVYEGIIECSTVSLQWNWSRAPISIITNTQPMHIQNICHSEFCRSSFESSELSL